MDRKGEIDYFIKSFANYLQTFNPYLNDDLFYTGLQNYDYTGPEIDQNKNLMFLFDRWIAHFSQNPNINVRHDMRQAKFLQFHSNNCNARHIKLYVSLIPSALEQGVNRIFEFIAANRMNTASKVAGRLRSDAIVLRIEKPEDAEKVIQFINSDPYLVNNSRRTNPFLNRAGIVGVGYDDKLSYNGTVAFFMNEYFKSKQNNYQMCGADDFLNFLVNKYNKIFGDRSEATWFTQSHEFIENCDRISGFTDDAFNATFENYKEVMQAMITNIRQRDYREIYTIAEGNQRINERKEQCLMDFIRFAAQKYDGYEDVIQILDHYAKGNELAITRDQDFRNRFHATLSFGDIATITKGDLRRYVEAVLNIEHNQENVVTETIDEGLDEFTNRFIQGCRGTYAKYGYKQLRYALDEIMTGNFRGMTDDDGCRSYFNNFDPRIVVQKVTEMYKKILEEITLDVYKSASEQIANYMIMKYNFGSQSMGAR